MCVYVYVSQKWKLSVTEYSKKEYIVKWKRCKKVKENEKEKGSEEGRGGVRKKLEGWDRKQTRSGKEIPLHVVL